MYTEAVADPELWTPTVSYHGGTALSLPNLNTPNNSPEAENGSQHRGLGFHVLQHVMSSHGYPAAWSSSLDDPMPLAKEGESLFIAVLSNQSAYGDDHALFTSSGDDMLIPTSPNEISCTLSRLGSGTTAYDSAKGTKVRGRNNSNNTKAKLRRASRKPKATTVSEFYRISTSRALPRSPTSGNGEDGNRPDDDERVVQARKAHNYVEKQYRNRLNASFEQLLANISDTSTHAQQGSESECSNGQPSKPNATSEQRPLSKAEVINLAITRIKELEEEQLRLEEERDSLKRSYWITLTHVAEGCQRHETGDDMDVDVAGDLGS